MSFSSEVKQEIEKVYNLSEERNVVKNAFLSMGSINNPEKTYHLEIIFSSKEEAENILNICKENGVSVKITQSKGKFIAYIKEGEEISKFLAMIGANKAVLRFEEIRVNRDMKNNVNRLVNCETANLSKTVNAAVNQINDIKLIQNANKFDELSEELKQIALLRIEHPDATLKELGEFLELGKSGANHRMKKIHELAEELRK